MNLAQRRAAKAVRRKAIVQAKRQADVALRRAILDLGPGAPPNKASAALIDLAEPLIGDTEDLKQYREGLLLAMVAWNLSLLPPDERQKPLREMFDGALMDGVPPAEADELRRDYEALVARLISRKLLLYPLDRRWLLNLDVVPTGHGFRVSVGSARDAPS